MSDEITVSLAMQVTNGNYTSGQIRENGKTFDQAAVGCHEGIAAIGTTEESLSTGDITTEGWLFLKNLDATNYVQWGGSTGVYIGRLEAAESAMFRLEPAATVYLKANTASCNVQFKLNED